METEFTDEEIVTFLKAYHTHIGNWNDSWRAAIKKALELRPAPAMKEGWRLLEEGEERQAGDRACSPSSKTWVPVWPQLVGTAYNGTDWLVSRRCMIGPDIAPDPEPTPEEAEEKLIQAAYYDSKDTSSLVTFRAGWKAAKFANGIK